MNDLDQPIPDAEMESRLMVATLVVLHEFSNIQLAAFNLAITLYGRVAEGTISFDIAKNYGLINANGSVPALEETKRAVAIVITQRVEDGKWL
jgi:hypothetical protein